MARSEKAETLKEILTILNKQDKYAKTEEVRRFFTAIRGFLANLDERIFEKIDRRLASAEKINLTEAKKIAKDIDRRLTDEMNTMSRKGSRSVEDLTTDMQRKFLHLADLIESLPRIEEMRVIAEEIREAFPKVTREVIRDELESFEEEEDKLAQSAIKGLEEDLHSIKSQHTTYIGGPRGVDILVDGSDKGFSQYLNLIAGPGVSLSYARVGERVDVTITASGSGLSVLIPTSGAVNDSNTAFTFASEPELVVINGAPYRDTKGVTITGTSVTTEYPVGDGGDIYGLG